MEKYGSAVKKGDKIMCVLDRVNGTLSFFFNGKDQGQGAAYADPKLISNDLYWAVWIDRGHDEVKII